jgi:hypothetical protein
VSGYLTFHDSPAVTWELIMTAIPGQDSINVAVSGIKKIPDYKMRRPA